MLASFKNSISSGLCFSADHGESREDKQQMQEIIVSRTTRHLWAAAEKNGLAGDRQLTWRKMSFTGTVVQWLCVDGGFLH